MDFPNNPIKHQSIIDSREINLVNPSIIDSYHEKFIATLQDESFDPRMTRKIVSSLSEAEIEELLDYVVRKATRSKGRAFAKLCGSVINHQRLA